MMYNPRPDVVAWLQEAGINVTKQSQNVFNELPIVTYYVIGQSNTNTLDREIGSTKVAIQIDIYSDEGPQGSALLQQIEAALRQKNYELKFSSDVPNPDETLNHITARFEMNK